MNKREIVMNHRKAADELSAAKLKKKQCVKANGCKSECGCELIKNIEQANETFNRACEMLNVMNSRTIRKNDGRIDRKILGDETVSTNVEQLKKDLQNAEDKWTAALSANVKLQSEKEELQSQLKESTSAENKRLQDENKVLKQEVAKLQTELTKANTSINDLLLEVSEKVRNHGTPDEELEKRYNKLVTIAKPILEEFVASL